MEGIRKAHLGILTVLVLMLVSIKRRLPAARKLSSGITTLALAGIVLLVAAGSASALPACPAPGNVGITASCELTQSYNVPADQTGYIIGANGVTIDGKGYTITGAVTGSDCTISVTSEEWTGEAQPASHAAVVNKGYHHVVLKNLKIEKFCTGISLKNTENTTVTGCDICDNGKSGDVTHGVHMAGVWNSAITKNAVHNNTGSVCGCGGGGNGIFTYGGDNPAYLGDYNKITCNHLYDNEKAGFFSKKKCAYNTISYNNVTGNHAGGIILRCANTHNTVVEYNNVSNNLGTGIYFRSDNTTLRYNTVINNQNGSLWAATCGSPTSMICDYGVGVEVQNGGTNAKIYNNTICDNDAWDIDDNSAGGSGGYLVGDYNACGTCSGYVVGDAHAPGGQCCVYTCDNKVPVYFDFDKDTHYSPASCRCLNKLCVGACCNPGLFNVSHANMLNGTSPPICWLVPGDDTNDCDYRWSVCGDVDGDGLVTGFDDYLVNINDIRTTEWAADVDCDGYITGFDAYQIYTNTLNCCCG